MRQGLFVVPVLAIAAVIVACGGYGGAGSTSMPGATAGAAGVSVGAITGFGSVHLNGHKFETTSATIHVDGEPGTQSDLHVGDVIELKGHHDSSTGKDIADEIEFRRSVQGPVSVIDTAAQTLVVLGQTVVVTADTSFDDSITPASLAGVSVGDILAVSGMPETDGAIHATRIERKPAGAALQVIGTAASTDPTAKTLKVNALVIDFSAATLADFSAGAPKDGDLVEATGTTLNTNGTLVATRLELRTGKILTPDASAESEIEGLISRFASVTDFDVAGRRVTTSSSTTFDGGTAGDLALNVMVEAEGPIDASGVMAATKIELRKQADTRVVGQVDSVDAISGTVVVMGIQVAVDAMTRFEDHTSQNINTFSVSDVHSGDWLEIRGRQTSAGANAIEALRIDRTDAQPAVSLTGTVASTAQPIFIILATSVATTNSTQFGNGLDATTFFASVAGQMASVQGSWNGTTLTATQVSLGGDDVD